MSHDATTFSTCGEMMSGWQDSFMLKVALQPIGDQSLISRRLVAEDFRIKVFMKSVGDRSATCRRLIADFWKTFATSRRSKSVTASLLCMLKRLAATDFHRRPIGDLVATFVIPCRNLSAIANDFSLGEVASSVGLGLYVRYNA